MHQPGVFKPPDTGHRLVPRVVGGEVIAHQVMDAVAAAEKAGEMDALGVVNVFNDAQRVPRGVEGLLDLARGGGPAGVVEGGPVQQLEAALEGIVRVHAASPRRRGPARVTPHPAC